MSAQRRSSIGTLRDLEFSTPTRPNPDDPSAAYKMPCNMPDGCMGLSLLSTPGSPLSASSRRGSSSSKRRGSLSHNGTDLHHQPQAGGGRTAARRASMGGSSHQYMMGSSSSAVASDAVTRRNMMSASMSSFTKAPISRSISLGASRRRRLSDDDDEDPLSLLGNSSKRMTLSSPPSTTKMRAMVSRSTSSSRFNTTDRPTGSGSGKSLPKRTKSLQDHKKVDIFAGVTQPDNNNNKIKLPKKPSSNGLKRSSTEGNKSPAADGSSKGKGKAIPSSKLIRMQSETNVVRGESASGKGSSTGHKSPLPETPRSKSRQLRKIGSSDYEGKSPKRKSGSSSKDRRSSSGKSKSLDSGSSPHKSPKRSSTKSSSSKEKTRNPLKRTASANKERAAALFLQTSHSDSSLGVTKSTSEPTLEPHTQQKSTICSQTVSSMPAPRASTTTAKRTSSSSQKQQQDDGWTCVCGFQLQGFMKFCGLCATPQHWKCDECQFDKNLCIFKFCGGCGEVKQSEQKRKSSSVREAMTSAVTKVAASEPSSPSSVMLSATDLGYE